MSVIPITMIAQRDLKFTNITIPKGTPLNPATPAQIEDCKNRLGNIYDYYTKQYNMVLINTGTEPAWVFPSDYMKIKRVRVLSKEQAYKKKTEIAQKLMYLWGPDSVVYVKRSYGGDYSNTESKGRYIAIVEVPNVSETIWRKYGDTELQALKNLLESGKTLALQCWNKRLPETEVHA